VTKRLSRREVLIVSRQENATTSATAKVTLFDRLTTIKRTDGLVRVRKAEEHANWPAQKRAYDEAKARGQAGKVTKPPPKQPQPIRSVMDLQPGYIQKELQLPGGSSNEVRLYTAALMVYRLIRHYGDLTKTLEGRQVYERDLPEAQPPVAVDGAAPGAPAAVPPDPNRHKGLLPGETFIRDEARKDPHSKQPVLAVTNEAWEALEDNNRSSTLLKEAHANHFLTQEFFETKASAHGIVQGIMGRIIKYICQRDSRSCRASRFALRPALLTRSVGALLSGQKLKNSTTAVGQAHLVNRVKEAIVCEHHLRCWRAYVASFCKRLEAACPNDPQLSRSEQRVIDEVEERYSAAGCAVMMTEMQLNEMVMKFDETAKTGNFTARFSALAAYKDDQRKLESLRLSDKEADIAAENRRSDERAKEELLAKERAAKSAQDNKMREAELVEKMERAAQAATEAAEKKKAEADLQKQREAQADASRKATEAELERLAAVAKQQETAAALVEQAKAASAAKKPPPVTPRQRSHEDMSIRAHGGGGAAAGGGGAAADEPDQREQREFDSKYTWHVDDAEAFLTRQAQKRANLICCDPPWNLYAGDKTDEMLFSKMTQLVGLLQHHLKPGGTVIFALSWQLGCQLAVHVKATPAGLTWEPPMQVIGVPRGNVSHKLQPCYFMQLIGHKEYVDGDELLDQPGVRFTAKKEGETDDEYKKRAPKWYKDCKSLVDCRTSMMPSCLLTAFDDACAQTAALLAPRPI
jgi:hypothetical protein